MFVCCLAKRLDTNFKSRKEKKKMRGSNLFQIVFLLFSLIQILIFPTQVPASGVVPFKVVRDFLILLPVYLDDSGPYDFLLDMGSNRTLIAPSVLQSHRAEFRNLQDLVTVSGIHRHECYTIGSLQLGAVSFRNLEVLASPMDLIPGISFAGVLGQDVLGKLDYLLDYRHRRFIIEENGEFADRIPQNIDVFEIQRYASRMMIMVPRQSAHGRPPLLVLDSGSAGLGLFGRGPDSLGLRLDAKSFQADFVSTVSGRKTVISGILPILRFKKIQVENLPVVFAGPASLEDQRVEDGLLPTSCFEKLYVSNSRNLVVLNPKFSPRD